eukprot:CAMPEP_0114489006 /NCGR_PEP_ID=MMETSP0109-20121206/1646_1 /TAXON_ID=29199 /ORGANISM="Chlorarachnion reptans, Strain CCCM449" /LENGTH=538 /DNA_ID=CAMNT_0001665463 /DNA_START=362 /DNA_END=1979 /DNA_ORIENTATION=+
MDYWKSRPNEEVAHELQRLGIRKEQAKEEEILDLMVEEIAKLNRKHSSRSRSVEEKRKRRPAATFAWTDFIVAAVKQVPNDPPTKEYNTFSGVAYAPDAPRTETNYPSALPPRVVGNGNGMSQEELARRVMSGAGDLTDIYDDSPDGIQRSPDGINRGYSSRGWQGGTQTAPQRTEAPGRFGHYKDPALSSEVKTSEESAEIVWQEPTSVGKPYTSVIPIKEKKEEKKNQAEGSLVGCTTKSIPDHLSELAACVIHMSLKGKARGKKPSASFILDTSRTHGSRALRASKKLFTGAHPLGDTKVAPAAPVTMANSFLQGSVSVDGVFDASFLSQFDLDINFKKKSASFFEPGTLLRHNPVVEDGRAVDLPLAGNGRLINGAVTVRARLRKQPGYTPEGLKQIDGDYEEVLAVLSTRHAKSLISPKAAALFMQEQSESPEKEGVLELVGAMGGGKVGSYPSSIDAVHAEIELATDTTTIRGNKQKIEVMDRLETEALREFERANQQIPDIIIGLDFLAGPENANRISISWAHERIRFSTP